MQQMNRTESKPADPIARARSVVSLLKDAAPRIEQARELPADVLAALHDARLFRLALPRSVGGDEIDLATHAQVLEIIAAADASTAWVMSQGAGCSMAAAYLSPESARRWFGAKDAVLAWGAGIQGRAVKVEGGYRVTGTWTFASGSRHATLLGGHSFVYEADGSRPLRPDGRPLDRTALFARAMAKVDDVWHTVGLRGTGSDTFSVTDLFVPEEDTVDRDNPDELVVPATLYRFPTTLVYGVGFSALMVGIARSMIDELTKLAMVKTPRAASMSMRDSPVFQTQLAQLEARHAAGRAYLLKTATDLYAEVETAGEITTEQKARVKLATTYVINHCFEIVTDCYRAAGQHAIFPSNPFERRMRDAMTASQQTQARGTNYITCGRIFLGLDNDDVAFV
ncbi:MAG: acyl-CoA dehydrogenase family protein [Gammaproteobacteria bacterium]|nr:acyl-CoA dehydrogenase family protein [Gammaproteobacteria bacterium]